MMGMQFIAHCLEAIEFLGRKLHCEELVTYKKVIMIV